MWTHCLEPVLGGRGVRCSVSSGAGDLSFDQALQLLRTEPKFRTFVSDVITVQRVRRAAVGNAADRAIERLTTL
jgi:hypothetical protein